MDKKSLFLLLTVVFVAVISVIGFAIYRYYFSSQGSINSFEDCAEAGNPIMEIYPPQCVTPDGRVFTQDVSGGDGTILLEPPTNDTNDFPEEVDSGELYGSSTGFACNNDSDCTVSGCNGEVCQGASEEGRVSICLDPQRSTYAESGYNCGCNNNSCSWSK